MPDEIKAKAAAIAAQAAQTADCAVFLAGVAAGKTLAELQEPEKEEPHA